MSDTIKETTYMFKKYCRENNRFKQDVLEALMWFYMTNDNADGLIFGDRLPEVKELENLAEVPIKKLAQIKLPLKSKFPHYKKFIRTYDKY